MDSLRSLSLCFVERKDLSYCDFDALTKISHRSAPECLQDRVWSSLLLLRDNLLDLRNLWLNVIFPAPEPGQGPPCLLLLVVPHQPDRGLGQPPAEEEEHQAGAAEGEGVILHRHHQAQAQPQQRAQVVGEAVQASQQLPVPDQADLRGNYKCRNGEL